MAVPSMVVYGPVLEVYSYTLNFGGNTILAPCLQRFCYEVRVACLMGLLSVTNLGEIGNLIHQLEALASDHNPWVQVLLAGIVYALVRALDFGGRDWPLLLEFWNWKYAQRDRRVYYFGYTNSNLSGKYTGLTIWGGDGSTRPGTDGPHAHLSVTCANGFDKRFGTYNYTAALNDTSDWGLVNWLLWRRGHAKSPFGTTNPTSPITVEDVTVWEDDVDFMLKPGEERLVTVPRGADYCDIAAYGGNGEVQVQLFPLGAVGGVWGGNPATLNSRHAQPVQLANPVRWSSGDFSATKYARAFFRNTTAAGGPLIAVTIGKDPS